MTHITRGNDHDEWRSIQDREQENSRNSRNAEAIGITLEEYYEKYPLLDPDNPYNIARNRTGYVVYHDPDKSLLGFRYSIARDGSYLTCASTLWGARREIRKDRKKRAKRSERAYYENIIVWQEES